MKIIMAEKKKKFPEHFLFCAFVTFMQAALDDSVSLEGEKSKEESIAYRYVSRWSRRNSGSTCFRKTYAARGSRKCIGKDLCMKMWHSSVENRMEQPISS